jgi:hypothetical protein
MNGKECDPKEFLTRIEHDRSCPALQSGWNHWIEEFMHDSKDERAKLWKRADDHEKLINDTIHRAQCWLIGLLIAIIGGFIGIVVTRHYSDMGIIGEIHKMQQVQSQIGWQSGKPIGNGD